MALFSFAPKSGTKMRLRISGMHCVSCSLLIDSELEELPGVHSAATNFARAETEISFDSQKVTLAAIKKTIRTLGYEATEQTN